MATIIDRIKNLGLFGGTSARDNKAQGNYTKNLGSYIAPVQLQRLRHDVQMWRDAVTEAENAWYPHRVRMQRMYVDTSLNGHVLACLTRRKDLTLLREFCFINEAGEENPELKKIFTKKWFASFLEYALDAQFYGYSLIQLGDVVNDSFPQLSIIRRFNISPDRMQVTNLVYSLTGIDFTEQPYADWHVWVPTGTDAGISKCGYGLLYSVAMYEILLRNMLAHNADAAELYGMPIRKGKTTKTDEAERAQFEQALANMGSAGYILLDTMDELELVESSQTGSAFQIYADLESRMEKKISKIILGHADALDSTPGKLGGAQGADESPAGQALADKQAKDGRFLEDVVNDLLLPKMRNLGFNLPDGFRFQFSNNSELEDKRIREDANNKVTAEIVLSLKKAGLDVDPAYITERTGIPCQKSH